MSLTFLICAILFFICAAFYTGLAGFANMMSDDPGENAVGYTPGLVLLVIAVLWSVAWWFA